MEVLYPRGTWKALIDRNDFMRGFALRIGLVQNDNSLDVVSSLTLEHYPAGVGAKDKPLLEGSQGEAFVRAILNAAWDAGLRPDGYLDTRESMKHIDAHLQDMRKLVFQRKDALEAGKAFGDSLGAAILGKEPRP